MTIYLNEVVFTYLPYISSLYVPMKYFSLAYRVTDCWVNVHCMHVYIHRCEFFVIGIVGGGVQLDPLGTAATNRPIVRAPGDYDDGEIGGMIGRGNRSTIRKPAPVPLCPPQTPTCCPDANPGRRGGKPATNRLSYGTAFLSIYVLA
jgi:hypothetical protein